jgi:hypothetical protein
MQPRSPPCNRCGSPCARHCEPVGGSSEASNYYRTEQRTQEPAVPLRSPANVSCKFICHIQTRPSAAVTRTRSNEGRGAVRGYHGRVTTHNGGTHPMVVVVLILDGWPGMARLDVQCHAIITTVFRVVLPLPQNPASRLRTSEATPPSSPRTLAALTALVAAEDRTRMLCGWLRLPL